MFELNQQEKDVLKIIRDFSDRSERLDYYKLIDTLNIDGDTSPMIPVVGRLEDDGYITSNGLIFRYLHITEKGRKEAGN